MVKLLNYNKMNQQTSSKEIVAQVIRVANLYRRIEQMPVPAGNGKRVTTREIHTIEVIGKKQPITVTQIGKYFGITKSAASQMSSKLIEKRYVYRDPSPHSNKEFHLFLTPLGRKADLIHQQFDEAQLKDLEKRFEKFPAENFESFGEILSIFEHVMNLRLSSG